MSSPSFSQRACCTARHSRQGSGDLRGHVDAAALMGLGRRQHTADHVSLNDEELAA
jgi:hypothetical protein